MTTIAGLPLRGLRAEDAPAVIALVERAYAEYPGCVLDLPGVDADLPHLADVWRGAGGRGWVVEDGDEVVACVGLTPAEPPSDDRGAGAELKRLYVASSHRRRGLGRGLVELVERHAVDDHGAAAVELWSDTRFGDAHRLYQRCGYEHTGRQRRLHDPSATTEYHFVHVLAHGG